MALYSIDLQSSCFALQFSFYDGSEDEKLFERLAHTDLCAKWWKAKMKQQNRCLICNAGQRFRISPQLSHIRSSLSSITMSVQEIFCCTALSVSSLQKIWRLITVPRHVSGHMELVQQFTMQFTSLYCLNLHIQFEKRYSCPKQVVNSPVSL